VPHNLTVYLRSYFCAVLSTILRQLQNIADINNNILRAHSNSAQQLQVLPETSRPTSVQAAAL